MMADRRCRIGRRPACSTRQRFAHGQPPTCHLSFFTFHTLLVLGTAATAQFCYVANGGGSNNVSGYKIESTGGVISISGSPLSAGNFSAGGAGDPESPPVHRTNKKRNNVYPLPVVQNRGLSSIAGFPLL